MSDDRIDLVLQDWSNERPDLKNEDLGIVLRIQVLAKLLAEKLTHVLAKLDLEWWEYDVLSALRRQGEPFQLTASEIAESAMLSPGALTNRIDRLVKRELVKRLEDPEDRRKVLIRLTEKGEDLVDQATVARFGFAKHAVSSLEGDHRRQLDTLLRNLLLSLDPGK